MSIPPKFETVRVDVKEGKKKKTRKERLQEQREFDKALGLNKGVGGLKYDQVADRHLDDDRFERELAFKRKQGEGTAAAAAAAAGNIAGGQSSATFDAFMRMASGKEQRTVADRINDTNRPTWDDYKKKNEDALDMEGSQLKKMADYRKNLDAEREAKLKSLGETDKKRPSDAAISSDEQDDDNDSNDDDVRSNKKKISKKKHSKKKKKKHKTNTDDDDDEGDDDDDSNSDDSKKHKKHKKEKKSKKKKNKRKKHEKKDGPGEENDKGFKYSDFFNNNSDSESD